MGWNDRMMSTAESVSKAICPECGKRMRIHAIEQTPGFRSMEELKCPHCGKVLKESMAYEYSTEKL